MRMLAVVLALSLTGCGGDSPTGPSGSSVAGTWRLQSINGTSLPYVTAQTGADKDEITADVLTVDAVGSFTQISTYRFTRNGVVTTQSYSDAGAYALTGTAVSIQWNSGGTSTGSLSGNTFTIAQAGTAYIYKK